MKNQLGIWRWQSVAATIAPVKIEFHSIEAEIGVKEFNDIPPSLPHYLPIETSELQPEKQGSIFRLALQLFDNFIKLQLILKHNVFNEEDAAFYCRCSIESIRYHALTSRKLTFLKFSKGGLVFLKSDLENFLKNYRTESVRDR